MAISTLYIIATPLGNLNDVTVRATETLKSLTYLFAEDSRELRKLLQALGISQAKQISSYAAHNMKAATERAIELLKEGHDVGLVTNRGTPGISDPGALLVSRAQEAGVRVVPIPGPSSVTTILSVSGFVADRFVFAGFLPDQKKERERLYENIQRLSLPVCFFESPRRIRKTLRELADWFPSGTVFLGREMTKVFETFQKLQLSQLDEEQIDERGEYTVVFEAGEQVFASPGEWEQEVQLRLMSDKEWAKIIAERYQITAKEVYNTLQKQKASKFQSE